MEPVSKPIVTLHDLLPHLKTAKILEIQDTMLEASLAKELGLDWRVPILRRINKYPAGRLRKVYQGLLAKGLDGVETFIETILEEQVFRGR